MVTTFPGEAERILSGMWGVGAADGMHQGITVYTWLGDRESCLVGAPVVFDSVDKAFVVAEDAAPRSYDLIMIALPAFAHDSYLNALAAHITSNTMTGHRTVLAAAVAQVGTSMIYFGTNVQQHSLEAVPPLLLCRVASILPRALH